MLGYMRAILELDSDGLTLGLELDVQNSHSSFINIDGH